MQPGNRCAAKRSLCHDLPHTEGRDRAAYFGQAEVVTPDAFLAGHRLVEFGDEPFERVPFVDCLAVRLLFVGFCF